MNHPATQQNVNGRIAQRRKEREDFKASLLKELGIEGHPKADMLFDIAWNNGHASGFHEVKSNAEELLPLITDDAVSVLRDQLQRTQKTASIRLTALWRYRGMVSDMLADLSRVLSRGGKFDALVAKADLTAMRDRYREDFCNAISKEGDPDSSRIEEDRLMADRYRALRLYGCRIDNGPVIGIDELDAAADKIAESHRHD